MRVILLFLALLAVTGCDRQKPVGQQGGAQEGEAGAPIAGIKRGIDRSHKGRPFPEVVFRELEHDSDMTYESLLGVPALVNLWATWCGPCVKELPSLNALAQQRMADLAVIPISQDMAPRASVNAFLDRLDVANLGRYQDDKMALSAALGVEVMPTTILYDAEGREVWRYVGDLDWTGVEAQKLLDEAA